MTKRLTSLTAFALFLLLCVGSTPTPTALAAEPEPTTTTQPAPPPPPAPPEHCADYNAMEAGVGHPTNQDWFNHLDARGYAQVRAACVYQWGTAEWNCLNQLWNEESSWRHNIPSGIPQAMPQSKMAAAGADWRTNPRTQVRWGLQYISDRYDRPMRATFRNRPCHAGY